MSDAIRCPHADSQVKECNSCFRRRAIYFWPQDQAALAAEREVHAATKAFNVELQAANIEGGKHEAEKSEEIARLRIDLEAARAEINEAWIVAQERFDQLTGSREELARQRRRGEDWEATALQLSIQLRTAASDMRERCTLRVQEGEWTVDGAPGGPTPTRQALVYCEICSKNVSASGHPHRLGPGATCEIGSGERGWCETCCGTGVRPPSKPIPTIAELQDILDGIGRAPRAGAGTPEPLLAAPPSMHTCNYCGGTWEDPVAGTPPAKETP